MKTFSRMIVLTMIMGMSMGGAAMANFDDEDVREGALQIKAIADQAGADLRDGDLDVPIIQRRCFAAGFRGMSQKAQQIANLANADDEDEVQDQMLQLAGEIRTLINNLKARANVNAEVLDVLNDLDNLTDELIDDLD
jgi:hypothetical protein